MGERLEGFLDRAHEDALIAAVAQEVAQIVPCCSIGLDDEDRLLTQLSPLPPSETNWRRVYGQVVCQIGESYGGCINLFTYVLALSQEFDCRYRVTCPA